MDTENKLVSLEDLKQKHDYDESTYQKIDKTYYQKIEMADYSIYGTSYCPKGRWCRIPKRNFVCYPDNARFYLINIRVTVQAVSESGLATLRIATGKSATEWGTSVELPYGTSLSRTTIPINTAVTSAFNTTFLYDLQRNYTPNEIGFFCEIYGTVDFRNLSGEIYATPVYGNEYYVQP